MSENFEIHFSHESTIKNLDETVQKLKGIVGEDKVTTDEIHLLAYGKDYWLISARMTLEGVQPSLPDVVVWPTTTEQVSQILK